MWKITENLYLAQLPMIDGPTRKEALRKNNIKRVLTVMTEPIPADRRLENVEYRFLQMYDMPSQEILENGLLAEGVGYIQESVENEENVVVHCLAAVSRSVTMCVAYVMITNRWSSEKALKMVKSIRKSADPNPGFMAQLKIWERSDFNLDLQNYRDLQITIPGERDVDEKFLWRQPVLDFRAKTRFKCRSCRKLLFNADNIAHFVDDKCQVHLVEPMKWLTVTDLECSVSHTCGAKLGDFKAKGGKCRGCSKFVKPWIFIDKSKIDRVEPQN